MPRAHGRILLRYIVRDIDCGLHHGHPPWLSPRSLEPAFSGGGELDLSCRATVAIVPGMVPQHEQDSDVMFVHLPAEIPQALDIEHRDHSV